ncbi:MAG TPA: glycosyltransferase [Conexibacter sp.]|nr:glycosyltransferase [Conexibacter sp.]
MEPLVTCVVCAYDYGAYVEAAVRSALEQEGLAGGAGALEVIVVDDGSTDDTPAILASFGDAITVLHQQNEGPAVATNRAIARARGRYVSLLDADDLWLPDKLARQIELLEARPAVGLVHGDMEVIDAAGRVTRPSKHDWYGELPVVGRALGRLLAQNEATTSAITLRTDLAQAIPPTPAWAWCRDWWLAAHVATTHEIDAVREPAARCRIHGDNVSAQDATSERAIRLWERDLRVRRILLRTLDLRNATLDELALAWTRFAGFLQRIAQERGIPQTQVVAVDDEDRAAATALRTHADALLAADPAAAGRAAAKAMAADPFDRTSAELFEVARAAAPPHDPTPAERERAYAELCAAVAARDDAVRRRHAARALVLDPRDDHARALAMQASRPGPGSHDDHRAGQRGPTARDAAQRDRFHARAATALDGAQAFVALADAEEAVENPALMSAWAAAFAPHDDATLALVADADADLAALQPRLTAALTAAGIDPDGEHDLAVSLADAGSAAEAALAREAHAVLSARPAERALAGHSCASPDEDGLTVLRALAERRWSHDGLSESLNVAITICPQRWDGAERWGDTHFARALADELERRGHRARLEVVAEWDAPDRPPADVTIHLRGLFPYVPRGGDELSVLWSISHPDLLTTAECDAFHLVATPSVRLAERLAARTRTPLTVIEQATDATVFFPTDERDPAHERELVFVGNSRGIFRPILRDLLPTEHGLAVWGQQWERFLPAGLVAGEHLPNEQVRHAYGSAAIVLNDHWDDMRAQGIVSNRVYDALACGALVVSDHLDEIPDRFGDAVVTYRTPEDLRASVARLLADPAERAERAARGRTEVLARHTFRHRVDALLAAVAAQRAPSALKTASAQPIPCS